MADNYGTAAAFKTYWSDRGVDKSALDDADVTKALLVASEFIDAAFNSQWPGNKTGGREQIRDWPRSAVLDRSGDAVDGDEVPREVEYATYEAASRQLATPGIFFKDYTPSKYKSVSITGALSVEYAIGTAYAFQTQMPALAAVLGPLLGCYSTSSLSGAVSR